MIKETVVEVKKKWGKEIWLVNNDKYCGKIMHINAGAEASYHLHTKKTETFYCPEGDVILTVNGKEYQLSVQSRPKTILPGEPHKFKAMSDSVLIEFSTPHDEADVFRATESKEGYDYGMEE